MANTKTKRGKNRQKLFNCPWNVNFLFSFVPRNYYTKNRIQRQKMWAGWYRLKLHQSSGIRNRAMMLLCRDFLDACRKKPHHDLVFGRFENSICQTDDIRMILIVQCFSIHLCLFARKKHSNCLPNRRKQLPTKSMS